MWSSFFQYVRDHSHAILATIVAIQNTKLLHGSAHSVLDAVVAVMAAFGAN